MHILLLMYCEKVTRHHKDNLCCACAIVTKALVDANRDTRAHHYHNLKRGRPVQEIKAKELHQLSGVPEGPCSIPELEQFQTALPGYQIKVMSINPLHMIIYAGPTPSDKIIRLIKEGELYDGCDSFSRFISKSFFCDDCNRGLDHDDLACHPCIGKWCPSCKRKDCPDFLEAKQPLASGRHPTPTSHCPFNVFLKMWMIPKRNACLAMKWGRFLSRNLNLAYPDTQVLVEGESPLQVYCDYKAVTDAKGNETPFFCVPRPMRTTRRNLFTVPTAHLHSLTGWKS